MGTYQLYERAAALSNGDLTLFPPLLVARARVWKRHQAVLANMRMSVRSARLPAMKLFITAGRDYNDYNSDGYCELNTINVIGSD